MKNTTTATREATAKQVGFLTRLIGDRPGWAAENELTATTIGQFNRQAISQLIDAALQQPKETGSAEPVTEGMYRTDDGTVYRVVRTRDGRNLYAKQLHVDGNGRARFEYAGGAINRLSQADRMTLEEAKAIGATTGVCCVCAAELTDPRSVEAGIGPVCASRI